eukprot:272854_1
MSHESKNAIAKRNKLLLYILVILSIIVFGVMIILGFIVSDRINLSDKTTNTLNKDAICGTMESKAIMAGIYSKWWTLNNILHETNGENYDEWFDFYYHSVTDDFVYVGTRYTNNMTSLGLWFRWNSKEEFFITGNPELGIPPYETAMNRVRRGVTTNAYTECRQNNSLYAKNIQYSFIHDIDSTSLESNVVFSRIDSEFIYNSTQKQWLIKSFHFNYWEQ